MQNDTVIISSIDNLELATRIAYNLDVQLMKADLRIFSDGESKIRMDSVSNKRCIIIHSTYPFADQRLMQLFMMIYKCNRDGAKDICALTPYMAYSRQDKAFIDGEVISINLIGEILESIGTNQLVTVDIHNPEILSTFSFRTNNISAIPLLACYVSDQLKLHSALIISPDKGSINRAAELAKLLNTDMISLVKIRDIHTGEIQAKFEGSKSIRDRDVIILDDMITTGNSIINAAKVLKELGVKNIFVLCTHALLLENAIARLRDAGIKDIIATNSIPNDFARVDLAAMLSQYLLGLITSSRQ
ncbi:MAG: ribose-phosphate diphosphokinase [Thermoproteota archaeon]|nr:ribose-phosphate diphosphokinase [Thermoproteota archaeon]